MKTCVRRMITFLLALLLMLISLTSVFADNDTDSKGVQHDPLRVAMLQYPNFIDYDQNGKPCGFSCDYLDEIAKYTGWTYEYIPVSFKEAQQMLEEGTLDILPGTQYTEERAKHYDYCETSMVNDANVLCVLAENTQYYYNDYKQLEGKNIGVMTGSIRKEQFAKVLEEQGVTVNFVDFDTDAEEKEALEDGSVVAILMTLLRCTPEYRIIASSNTTEVYFTCNPNDPSIKKGIDEAQQEIMTMNPYYGLRLSEKYYDNVPRAYAFTDEERTFMKSVPTITVAVAEDMAPTEYYDSDTNTFQGLSIDYFEKISEITGIQFQYVPRGDADSTVKALQDGTLQMVATITEDASLENTYPIMLTDNYIHDSVVLVYNKNVKVPLDTGCRIALTKESVYYNALAKKKGYTDVVYYDSFSECVDAVNRGKADVTYVPGYSASNVTGHVYYKNLTSLSSEIAEYECAIGISKQCNPLLVSILDKALGAIPTAEKDAMLLNAVSNRKNDRTIKDTFYENLAVVQSMVVVLSVLTGILGACLAIRRKRVNQKLAEAMDTAQHANAAKADFMSRMSHDMRTPMNGILGLTELSEDENDIVTLKQNMKKINQSGQYLLCLINDTLDFQKIECGRISLQPQIISTRELISNVLMMIQMDAGKKNIDVQFTSENADLDTYVKVDPVRIKQIFFNLLSNAVKFTQPEGIIQICFQCSGHTGNIAHCVVTISDTGIGMSKDFIEHHIFQPFSQEHSDIVSNYSGSGLGLSISYKLVQLMKGTISVESELGAGTTFTIEMDFERIDESARKGITKQTEIQQEKIEESLRGKHILLAEDHPLNAEIAKKLLAKEGCIVEWVEDGKKCVECFEKSEENQFDAVLMDIRMPNMDGITATQVIRALSRQDAKNIPIIAMTANAYESDVKKCQEAGMNAHIGKPIDVNQFYGTLSQFIFDSNITK